MMRQIVSVNWSYIGDAIPAFITMVTMPFTYSVSYGLIAGLFSYTSLNGLIFLTRKITNGRIEPPDADNAEYWTINPHSGSPPWFIRAGRKAKREGVKAWPWKSNGVLEIESLNGSMMNGDQELQDRKVAAPRSREVSYAGRPK